MNTGRKKASQGVTYLVLSLWALTTIYPFIWVILNSFRQKGLIMSDSFSLPLGEAFTWDNYLTAWHRADFKNAYLNSFLISGTVTVCVVLIAGLAAYGLVRYRFRGRSLLYSLIMAGMMFPVFSTIIPVFRMSRMAPFPLDPYDKAIRGCHDRSWPDTQETCGIPGIGVARKKKLNIVQQACGHHQG